MDVLFVLLVALALFAAWAYFTQIKPIFVEPKKEDEREAEELINSGGNE